MLTMTAAIGQIPPDHRGGYELARRDLGATAEDHDAAMDDIEQRMPEGWRILSIRIDGC
jgi:hypothetical protein